MTSKIITLARTYLKMDKEEFAKHTGLSYFDVLEIEEGELILSSRESRLLERVLSEVLEDEKFRSFVRDYKFYG